MQRRREIYSFLEDLFKGGVVMGLFIGLVLSGLALFYATASAWVWACAVGWIVVCVVAQCVFGMLNDPKRPMLRLPPPKDPGAGLE
jgi:hypothetical protein